MPRVHLPQNLSLYLLVLVLSVRITTKRSVGVVLLDASAKSDAACGLLDGFEAKLVLRQHGLGDLMPALCS
jgi:hypothetical protein